MHPFRPTAPTHPQDTLARSRGVTARLPTEVTRVGTDGASPAGAACASGRTDAEARPGANQQPCPRTRRPRTRPAANQQPCPRARRPRTRPAANEARRERGQARTSNGVPERGGRERGQAEHATGTSPLRSSCPRAGRHAPLPPRIDGIIDSTARRHHRRHRRISGEVPPTRLGGRSPQAAGGHRFYFPAKRNSDHTVGVISSQRSVIVPARSIGPLTLSAQAFPAPCPEPSPFVTVPRSPLRSGHKADDEPTTPEVAHPAPTGARSLTPRVTEGICLGSTPRPQRRGPFPGTR